MDPINFKILHISIYIAKKEIEQLPFDFQCVVRFGSPLRTRGIPFGRTLLQPRGCASIFTQEVQ